TSTASPTWTTRWRCSGCAVITAPGTTRERTGPSRDDGVGAGSAAAAGSGIPVRGDLVPRRGHVPRRSGRAPGRPPRQGRRVPRVAGRDPGQRAGQPLGGARGGAELPGRRIPDRRERRGGPDR